MKQPTLPLTAVKTGTTVQQCNMLPQPPQWSECLLWIRSDSCPYRFCGDMYTEVSGEEERKEGRFLREGEQLGSSDRESESPRGRWCVDFATTNVFLREYSAFLFDCSPLSLFSSQSVLPLSVFSTQSVLVCVCCRLSLFSCQ